MPTSTLARVGGLVLVTAAALAATATPAAAHVTAEPAEITRGGYSRVSFQVPTESDTAGTVKLELLMPTDTPLTFVQAEPKAGWTATVVSGALDEPVEVNNTTITQAVRSVAWTADPGVRIAPDQFGSFSILLTGLPDNTDRLVIPALQTYDDGTVANWDQPPADGDEPESPAPVIALTGTNEHAHTDPSPQENQEDTVNAAPAADDTTRWLAGGGLLLAALALGIAVGSLLRTRRARGRTSE